MNAVLIVEDNEMNQKYVTGLMNKWGLKYRLASDKEEVLDSFFTDDEALRVAIHINLKNTLS